MKTPKLFIGGKFVRSESGRTYEFEGQNVPLASRKDVRDAVVASRKAQPGWGSATAYNRAQVIYRLAEMLDDSEAVDYAIHVAGWADKFAGVVSSVNPVAGAMHNFTVPEPVGVVAVYCGGERPLLDFLRATLPPIAAGCAVVAVLPEERPLPTLECAEQVATSDLPGGVLNMLTGKSNELLPVLASHVDVDALDLSACESPVELMRLASDSVKRVWRFKHDDDTLLRIEAACEFKTVWHSVGA